MYLKHMLELEAPTDIDRSGLGYQLIVPLMEEFNRRTGPLRDAFRKGDLTTEMLQKRLDQIAEFMKAEGIRILGDKVGTLTFYDMFELRERPWRNESLIDAVWHYRHPLALIDRMAPERGTERL